MIERLDRMYALVWRDGDLDAAFADLPDAFEWVVPGHPDGAVRHGPHAVTDFFRDWIDQWDEPDTDWKLEVTRPRQDRVKNNGRHLKPKHNEKGD